MQRHHLVDRLRTNLERHGFPRLQMMLLVSLTGAVGFLASYTLLNLGLTQMWLRYRCCQTATLLRKTFGEFVTTYNSAILLRAQRFSLTKRFI